MIIDELGRGTATHDGVAIATATLQHLVTVKHCLTLFVTHYPEVAALADHSSSSSSELKAGSHGGTGANAAGHIAVYHMSYIRQGPPETAAEEVVGSTAAGSAAVAAAAASIPLITFLYKLTSGAADASFGLNVAQVCVPVLNHHINFVFQMCCCIDAYLTVIGIRTASHCLW